MFGTTGLVTKNKFTEDDDSKLRQCVELYGKDWKKVAELMENKNARQCRDRYEKYLAPDLKSDPFTIEEDIQLLTLYKKMGCQWINISKLMKGRSDVAIKARFRLLKRHGKTIQNLKTEKQKMKVPVESNITHKAEDMLFNIDTCAIDFEGEFPELLFL